MFGFVLSHSKVAEGHHLLDVLFLLLVGLEGARVNLLDQLSKEAFRINFCSLLVALKML